MASNLPHRSSIAAWPDDLRVALVLTGGGTGLISECLSRGGASQNIVEAVVPYSRRALADYLGIESVERACCESTVQRMACVAFERCQRLADSPGTCLGFAVTAVMPRKDHVEAAELFVAHQDARQSHSQRIELPRSNRHDAEIEVTRCLVSLLNDQVDVRRDNDV